MKSPFRTEERTYQIEYIEQTQVNAIEKILADLSGIYRPPMRTTGIGDSEDSFAHVKVEHTWTTKKAPYIHIDYNPFNDGSRILTIRSNVVTPEMVEQVQKALGLIKAA